MRSDDVALPEVFLYLTHCKISNQLSSWCFHTCSFHKTRCKRGVLNTAHWCACAMDTRQLTAHLSDGGAKVRSLFCRRLLSRGAWGLLHCKEARKA